MLGRALLLFSCAASASCNSADPPPLRTARPDCATLPACTGALLPENAYGKPCGEVAPGVPPGNWRGKAVCCANGTVYAACIQRGYGGDLCDPDEALSCETGLVCTENPSCDGYACCV